MLTIQVCLLCYILIVDVDYAFNEFIHQMSDDILYLRAVFMDIISTIDRFIGSRDPSIDFQPIVFKLDSLQRITVSLDVDDVVTELVGLAYSMFIEIDQRNHVTTIIS